jgi:hypothetical protein
MNISTDLVSAWCAIITVATLVGGGIFRHWSKRQDRAINKLESDVDRLKTHGIELRRYIRRLLFLLKNHHIEYPTPPDSFYDDTIPPHMLKGMIDNE